MELTKDICKISVGTNVDRHHYSSKKVKVFELSQASAWFFCGQYCLLNKLSLAL